ncbi:MAG: undecaprenyl-diphosphate phosphatase [Saprospiraceae bacterium]|nr:undecaprenyl-diphosphate phosphatase [Saprospiraceae bacterium]
MSEYLIALILGIVQGITEFLPISSDGHLELAKYLTGDQSKGLESLQLTVLLHIATTFSIIYVFRKNILQILSGLSSSTDSSSRIFAWHVILSMIPAAIVGLFFEEIVSSLFEGKILMVSILLIINGLILLTSKLRKPANASITPKVAILMGLAQMLAILPGISRSGSTISTAMLMGVDRNQAASFSFLMVVPLILGKVAKDLMDGDLMVHSYSIGAMAFGFVASFLTGIAACYLMIHIVKKVLLHYFAWYCMLVGIGMIAYLQFFS